MTDWTFGENVVERDSKAKLRECEFVDADTCPKPAEHTGSQRVYTYHVNDRVTLCKSQTEWISGIPWGEL